MDHSRSPGHGKRNLPGEDSGSSGSSILERCIFEAIRSRDAVEGRSSPGSVYESGGIVVTVNLSEVLDEVLREAERIRKCKGLKKFYRESVAKGMEKAVDSIRDSTTIDLRP
jgi:hypothetical protein